MRICPLAACCLLALPAFSQSFAPVRELKNLSPAAVEKLHTLDTLTALPAGDWRFHAGDIPHGESPALDDSSWTLVHPRSPAPREAVWYRRLVEIPRTLHGYDLTGSRISFQFQADANGPMPEIIYFNGRRVALGDDLEPIPLTDSAHPGDKVLIAVKLLHTVDEKRFRGVTMNITPALNSARPDPQVIRTEVISAANILPNLPTPRPDLIPKVEQALAAIDFKALAAGNQPLFDRSLRSAQTILTPLAPIVSQATIDMAGNSHIDAAWLWPRSETIDVVKRTFTTALQLMDEYPGYTFSQSAAQYTAWMADKYPSLNDEIRRRVQEGRWEIVGGMWVEPDLNLPGGESTVRQLLVGQRYFKSVYGVTARIGWNPDSFGYNWQLPQIYKRSGMDYFLTQKMHWNDTNTLPFRLFYWESPDGSKVLTYFPTDYTHDNVNPSRESADFAESAQRNPGTTEMLDLYGIGDHGGGPTRAMLDQADRWIDAGKKGTDAVPTMRFHTAQQYFTDVETHLNPTSPTWNYDSIAKGYTAPPVGPDGSLGIPTWNSELYLEYHRGVYTTQAAHKNNLRRSEADTLDTEKISSLAWLDGAPYPARQLNENWKAITFNGFHDLAAGSGIGIIYKDAQHDFDQVFTTDRELEHGALETISAHIDTAGKSGEPILVMNSMAWPRTETVRVELQLPKAADSVQLLDAENHPVLTQAIGSDSATGRFTLLARVTVPSFGYTVLHAEPAKPKQPASDLSVKSDPNTFTLSNGNLRLAIDRKTGCIVSLVSLPAGTETLAPGGCGNQLQTFKDTPKQYDAWNIDPGTLDGPMTPISEVDSIGVTDDGPLHAAVRIERTWGKSHFMQTISLESGAPMAEVENTIDWHETHVLLKAAFPLAATAPKATYEIPYGSIERTTLRNNSWEKAQFEVPAQQWADLGDGSHGFSLINKSKYGYDAAGNTLRLTLLRSPIWPDPNADRGEQQFRYALYPHAGSWKQAETVHLGYDLNNPLQATQTVAHAGALPATYSWISVDNPNVVISAVKKAEDADALIVRMYEWAGQPSTVTLHLPPGATAAHETNLMEKPEGDSISVSNNTVQHPIKPYEILTMQIAYPHSAR